MRAVFSDEFKAEANRLIKRFFRFKGKVDYYDPINLGYNSCCHYVGETNKGERFSIKESKRRGDTGTQAEAHVYRIAKICGFNFVTPVFCFKREGRPYAVISWNKGKEIWKNFDPRGDNAHLFYSLGTVFFFCVALEIGDRHCGNIMWDKTNKKIYLIDNEGAFGSDLEADIINQTVDAISEILVDSLTYDLLPRGNDNRTRDHVVNNIKEILTGFFDAKKIFDKSLYLIKKYCNKRKLKFSYPKLNKNSQRFTNCVYTAFTSIANSTYFGNERIASEEIQVSNGPCVYKSVNQLKFEFAEA